MPGAHCHTQAAMEGLYAVVAVGGDGTVHEVVNGLLRARQQGGVDTPPALCVLPWGTGCDLARTFSWCACFVVGRCKCSCWNESSHLLWHLLYDDTGTEACRQLRSA